MKVAIIGGSGHMGRWFARFLQKEGHEVVITGRNQKKLAEARQQLGVEATTDNIKAVKQAQVILLSVPIDNFAPVAEQIGSDTQPDQLIIDITSVKVAPVVTMHQKIKRGLVLGTHPLFGPGAHDITNRSFILTPTNEPERDLADKAKEYLETRGARVTLMTPEEHDEIMAVVLGLAHFIAIASADTLLSFSHLKQMGVTSGITFKLLSTLAESVISEDPELYASLQMNLPKLAEIERSFQKKVKEWVDLVERKDRQRFTEKMAALKDRFNQVNPNFSKAYEDMYKIVDGL